MADTEVESVLREIRERVRAEAARREPPAPRIRARENGGAQPVRPAGGTGRGEATEALARMEANLATSERAWNRLPPLLSNRTGWVARLELWLKRMIKRALRWFTWEQVNFNSAVHHALRDTTAALSEHERRLAGHDERLAASEKHLAGYDERLSEDERRLAEVRAEVRAEVESLRRLNAALESRFESHRAEAEALRATTEAQLAATEARLSASEAQLAANDAQLAATDVQLVATESRLSESESRLSATELQLSAGEARLSATESLMEATDKRIAATDERIAATGVQLETEVARFHEALAAVIAQLREEERSLAESLVQLRDEQRSLAADAGAERLAQLAGLQKELNERTEHLREELRVCFKQLSLEAGESAILHDRTRRLIEARIEAVEKTVKSREP